MSARLMLLGVVLLTGSVVTTARAEDDRPTLPVGVAKVDITPDEPVRLYGYASRTKESEGIAGRLTAKALALGGDEDAGPAVLLTVDLGAVPRSLRDEVLARVTASVPLKTERFMLANAHNHSGPNLKGLASLEGEQRERMARYGEALTAKLERVVLEALAARRPGRLEWTCGEVGFASNRRVLKDGKWSGFGAVPDAPVDHSLPLMRVTDAEGKLLALVVNYACHCTTLRGNFMQIHGDWAGAAQEMLEAEHPGALAMITIGCGADADPHPHSTVELCRAHGRELADEVNRLLQGPFRPVVPKLTALMTTLEVPAVAPADGADAKPAANEDEGTVTAPAPYEVAVWLWGEDLAMVFLNHEVVVDYALRMKRDFDPSRLWITAYTNDVSHYIVSDRLIGEGGYEVRNSLSSAVTGGQPERLRPSLEERIFAAVGELLRPEFKGKAAAASTGP